MQGGAHGGEGGRSPDQPPAAGFSFMSCLTHTGWLRRRGKEERLCFKKVLSSGRRRVLQAAGNPTRGGRLAGRGPSGGEGMKEADEAPEEFRQTPPLSTSGKGWL